jgi:hypothetical protein
VEDERIAWLQSKVDILDGQLWAAFLASYEGGLSTPH